jgi:hypothetical protein
MFQPSKAHLQGVRQMHFDRKINKINYQIKMQLIEGGATDGASKMWPICQVAGLAGDKP